MIASTAQVSSTFCLLDDSGAPATEARSRLYTELVAVPSCDAPARLDEFWR